MSQKISFALEFGIKSLRGFVDNPQKEASILLQALINKDKMWIILNSNKDFLEFEIYKNWIDRRKKDEPIEYITNKVSFYSEEFFIDYGALIPRPETELLIDYASKYIKKYNLKNIVEVGVGSGIISIILAKKFPDLNIIATDISKDALKIAKKNIESFNINNIKLLNCSLLDEIDDTSIDMVISNPPYIKEYELLEKNLSYEPQNALFGGLNGDEILHQLIDEVYKRDIKYIACEMGYDQKSSIQKYIIDKKYIDIEFYKDYANLDRGFILKKRWINNQL